MTSTLVKKAEHPALPQKVIRYTPRPQPLYLPETDFAAALDEVKAAARQGAHRQAAALCGGHAARLCAAGQGEWRQKATGLLHALFAATEDWTAPELFWAKGLPLLARLQGASRSEAATVAEALCGLYLEHTQTQNNPPHMVREAVQFLETQYARPLTLADVANHVHLSKAYLGQLFKREMGLTVAAYLEGVRVRRAQALLEAGERNVTEIAEAVGFSSQSYFSRVFKRAVGTTPLRYRSAGRAASKVAGGP